MLKISIFNFHLFLFRTFFKKIEISSNIDDIIRSFHKYISTLDCSKILEHTHIDEKITKINVFRSKIAMYWFFALRIEISLYISSIFNFAHKIIVARRSSRFKERNNITILTLSVYDVYESLTSSVFTALHVRNLFNIINILV